MTDVRAKLRNRARSLAALAAGCTLAVMSLAQSADARPYTVVACDSAPLFGYSAAAWTAFGNAGSAYAACPTGGGSTAGISNRLIGATYTGFSHSGHVFAAPPGATITHVRWAGRMAREGCQWGTYFRAIPSGAPIVGLPHGQHCSSLAVDNRGWPLTFPVPEGATRIEQLVFCGAAQCQPGATLHSHLLELTVDDPVPPSISLDGPLASGQWVSGRVAQPRVIVSLGDNSGIRAVNATIGGRGETQDFGCNWSQPQPCPTGPTWASGPSIAALNDGSHMLRVSATDAAGNGGSAEREVLVDNNAPGPIVPVVAGGSAWRRSGSYDVSWEKRGPEAAPIAQVHWRLCLNSGECVGQGVAEAQDVPGLRAFRVPSPGEYRLYIWLEDAAGNHEEDSAAVPADLRFDPEPPLLSFEPLDPSDPLRVAVNAADRHSGLSTGDIEMRRADGGAWHSMSTENQGTRLVAYVDDERFKNGSYAFRARATDRAGNEASTSTTVDGATATIRLPVRIKARLRAGLPQPEDRPKARRPGPNRKRYNAMPRPLDRSVTAMYGKTLRLHGFLTNPDGQPLEGATIETLEHRADGTLRLLGLATTKPDGTFRYLVRAISNRKLLFRYGGSRRIGPAISPFRLRVPATSTFNASRREVPNGQQLTFSGRVVTSPLPPTGKLLEMQAYFRGRWRTFSTVRTDLRGHWQFPYRFGATLGRVVYRFRARLPSESGYPFVTGHSEVLRVVVQGP